MPTSPCTAFGFYRDLLGLSEDEMRDAWDQAQAAGFTESTGLGQDRLTEKGRARANECRAGQPLGSEPE